MKHTIFGFITFIHHNKYVQITQTGTHQYTIYHTIQTLLDMSQRSYDSHILFLHLINLRLGDQQSIQIGSPIQAIYYTTKTQFLLISQCISNCKYT